MLSTKKILLLFLCLTFFQTANAGWTKQNSGTLAWLHSIFFVNEKNGWIVGSNGVILKTANGGESWQSSKKITEDNIRDVYFSDAQNGWLLCERNIYGGGGNSPSYLLKTSDGGANWEKINAFSEGRERIVRLFFSKDSGYAVGEAGALWMMTDDKRNWKKIALPVRYLLLDGKFADDLHGAIVGGNGTILLTDDHGLTWNPAAVADQTAAAKLNSVFFINRQVGWTVGAQGKILFTNNGGKLWRGQNSTVSTNLSDIFFISTAEGWTVGDDGVILHTTTAGNVWKAEEISSNYKLEKVFFVGEKGFAVGFGGTVLNFSRTAPEKPLRGKPQLQTRTSI